MILVFLLFSLSCSQQERSLDSETLYSYKGNESASKRGKPETAARRRRLIVDESAAAASGVEREKRLG